MTESENTPAQKQLVQKFINWMRVKKRLKKYPAINDAFPLEYLKSCKNKQPYYCHYMSWRLGTWHTESFFERLNELLELSKNLPNWSSEKPLLTSPEFSDFWSLVWQLQVAEYLCDIGTDVKWLKQGPDLSVSIDSEVRYVECYSYRKSFGLLNFIGELLRNVDDSISTSYGYCMPFGLPQNSDRSLFLDHVLTKFKDPCFIKESRQKALERYPVVMWKDSESKNGLVIYMEGPDPDAYAPGIVSRGVGDPQNYLEVVLKEALRNKNKSNDLKSHRPNLLVVNYLLSRDAQLATSRANALKLPIPEIQLNLNIDAFAISGLGINDQLDRSKLKRIVPVDSDDLALNLLTSVYS